MKKFVFFLLASSMLFYHSPIMAQQFPWLIGGNAPGGNRQFGTTTPFAVQFITSNVERGRLTNAGFWGLGTTIPNAKLHVSSAAGEDAFRVQVNGTTRFMVHNNGGVSVGSSITPTTNDLFVNGLVGIGTSAPASRLHIFNGTDASQAGGGFIITGALTGENIGIDNNEIMARNNGAATSLFLNHNGGNIIMQAGPNSDAGRLGIHTQVPEVEAHLAHGVGSGITNGFRIANRGANNENWTFYVLNSNGNLELHANNALRGTFNDNSGTYTTVSDLRLKKDIEKAEAVLPKVLQLDVKKYHFLKNAPQDNKYYGLIAQEVEKIFPEVVYRQKADNGSESYTMDYNAFGILAVKAIQELQKTITDQQQNIKNLQEAQIQVGVLLDRIEKLEAAKSANLDFNLSDLDLMGVSLEQNQPNPVNHTTTFRYSVPAGTTAQIMVFDAITGQRVKILQAPPGGQVQMNASALKAGTYVYSLVVNGKLAASKHLVLAK